jgi:hypothetical protein
VSADEANACTCERQLEAMTAKAERLAQEVREMKRNCRNAQRHHKNLSSLRFPLSLAPKP